MQLAQIRKALVAALAAAVLAYLAKHGLTADTTLQTAVDALANAVVAGGLVWFVPNKASKK